MCFDVCNNKATSVNTDVAGRLKKLFVFLKRGTVRTT